MDKPSKSKQPVRDHRIDVAEKKRVAMRAKLLDAAMRVYAEQKNGVAPVIDDVIKEAAVSRGTFYNYFMSMDEVMAALGQNLSNQMTNDILPMYTALSKPWQRFSVGFRLWLTRAMFDYTWAGFVTKVDNSPHDTLVTRYLANDIREGREQGFFAFEDIGVATDFLLGANIGCVQSIRAGVNNPPGYVNACLNMALSSLGCDASLRQQAMDFSSEYLLAWMKGELPMGRPEWAANLKITT